MAMNALVEGARWSRPALGILGRVTATDTYGPEGNDGLGPAGSLLDEDAVDGSSPRHRRCQVRTPLTATPATASAHRATAATWPGARVNLGEAVA